MLSLRFRSILNVFLAAILIAIIGCGGMSNSASNPSTPSNPSNPGGNPGGTGGGGGGGAPQSSTFVYFNNGNPSSGGNMFVFKLGTDGTLTAMSGSPFNDPNVVFGQTSKFLIGARFSGSAIGPTSYTVNTQTGVPQSRISSVQGFRAVTDGAFMYAGNGDGINAYSISSSGEFTLVPGSPFAATGNTQFFTTAFNQLQLVGSLLFGSFNTVKNAGNIAVFSRAANGALTTKFNFGDGNTPAGFVIHPTARFAYVAPSVPSLDGLVVYSLDMNANSATLIQHIQPQGTGFIGDTTVDPAGRFLFMPDNGMRVFSIDQNSGKLTEVSGSPFLAGDNSITGFGIDPSGHFLIVDHKNTVNVYAVNSTSGALTQVGASQSVGDGLFADPRFATF